jgi:hypothetical protein
MNGSHPAQIRRAALPVFFSLPACTDAESLELGRGFARAKFQRIFLKVKAYFAGGF